MASRQAPRGDQLQLRRQRIAAGAAQLITRLGLADYREAKRRAARELGFGDEASLPTDAQVRDEVIEYQRLFRGDAQAAALRERREAALEAMGFFKDFEPRLVGSVLDGTADEGAPVRLQVFSDTPEDIARFLLDADMPTRTLVNRRLRSADGTARDYPAWVFQARGIDFEVVVLPPTMLRQPPLGDDNQPMARANARTVRALLDNAR